MTVSDWGPDSPAAVERDAPPLPPSASAPARTPAPADTEEQDGTEALSDDHSGSSTWNAIQALAALLEPEAFDPNVKAVPEWQEPTQAVAVNHAAKVITSGYRLVSEDAETIARLVWAIAGVDGYQEGELSEAGWDIYAAQARAAVRALREAPSATSKPAQRQHDCCPHCTNRTGSCVRCGVRDAAEGEQLCEPCDREVEAEVTGRALREAGQS